MTSSTFDKMLARERNSLPSAGNSYYELEKGDQVISKPLSHGLNLSDLDNLIYDHIDQLIKKEIKS